MVPELANERISLSWRMKTWSGELCQLIPDWTKSLSLLLGMKKISRCALQNRLKISTSGQSCTWCGRRHLMNRDEIDVLFITRLIWYWGRLCLSSCQIKKSNFLVSVELTKIWLFSNHQNSDFKEKEWNFGVIRSFSRTVSRTSVQHQFNANSTDVGHDFYPCRSNRGWAEANWGSTLIAARILPSLDLRIQPPNVKFFGENSGSDRGFERSSRTFSRSIFTRTLHNLQLVSILPPEKKRVLCDRNRIRQKKCFAGGGVWWCVIWNNVLVRLLRNFVRCN